MYGFEEMIDQFGLKESESFKSDDHRRVAITIGIGNPNVKDRSTLQDAVSAVNSVPQDEIRLVTLDDLTDKYNMPCVM